MNSAATVGRAVLAHSRVCSVLVALVLAVLIAGALRIEVNNSARVFLAEGSAEKTALDELEAVYSKDENVIVVVEPPEGRGITSPETLRVVRSLTERLWLVPHSRKVVSLVNFVDPIADDTGEGIVVDELIPEGAEATPEAAERIAGIFEQRPDIVGNLVSADRQTLAIFLTVSMPSDSLTAVREVALDVRDVQRAFETVYPDYGFATTGLVMLDYALTEASDLDAGSLIPLMILLILGLIGALFRAVLPPAAVLLTALLSIGAAMGAVAWFGVQINTATAASPLIILAMAVANSVHVLVSTYKVRHRDPDATPDEVVSEALGINLKPLLIANLTTAIGFLSLNFSDVAPFRELGTIVAIGVLTNYVLANTLLPIILRWWLSSRREPLPAIPELALPRLAGWVDRKAKAIVSSMAAVAVIALLGMQLIKFNDDFVEYFDDRNAFRVLTDRVQEKWGGMGIIEYSLEAADGGTVSDPGYLGSVDRFADWVRGQNGVNSVTALPEQVKRLYAALVPPGERSSAIPDRPDVSAQLLAVFEMSAPYGHGLSDRMTPDQRASRFTVMTDNMSSAETIELADRMAAWLADNEPDLAASDPSGLSLAFAHVSERNSQAMLVGNMVAIALISALLLLAWRSIGLGLFSLVPNLLPIGMVFGLWGYFVGEVNLAITVIASITMGIIVDDTVYILTKFQEARKSGMSTTAAIEQVYDRSGLALLYTTVIIASGFFVLSFSSFAVNANLGLLASAVIVIALAYDFLFVPAVLILFERLRRQRVTTTLTSRPIS